MNTFLNRFRAESVRLKCADGRALLAVSGGRDSMTLAELCRISGIEMAIAHFNHGLRGEESDADEAFVRDYAHQHNISFFAARWEMDKAALDGVSIQDKAHKARMEWLGHIAKENGYDHLLVAHHADDALETYVMAALLRGRPGPLVGLRDTDGIIRRPLLGFSSSEIEEMAHEMGVKWRDDSSNATDKYLRNRVRHHLISLLRELNPGLGRHVSNQMAFQTEMAVATDAMAHEHASAAGPAWGADAPRTVFHIPVILSSPSPLLTLATIFKEDEPHFETLQRMVVAMRNPRGQHFLLNRSIVGIYDGELIVNRTDVKDRAPSLSFAHRPRADELPDGHWTIWVDAIKVDPAKCAVRPWKVGDRLRPFGMKGWKKVSDLLTDLKVRGYDRELAYVLEQEGEIVWVIGHRADDRFKVPDDARTVLEIRVSEPTA